MSGEDISLTPVASYAFQYPRTPRLKQWIYLLSFDTELFILNL
jgi:hypothetical protein